MKFFVTDKWLYNEKCKAREEVEQRYWERDERERLEKRIWELERRIELLENFLGKSYVNKTCDCNMAETTCEPLR